MSKNKYSQIKFCDKKASSLDNNTLREICKQLKFKYTYDLKKQKFEILNNSNFNCLKDNPHLVSFKLKGHNFLLFLTTIKGKKYCLFIEKKNDNNIKIYSVKFRFDLDLYNGTLFEGTLTVNSKQCWIYFINDIYCMSGDRINKIPFSKRLENISNILKMKYKYNDFMNVCHIQIQSFFLYHHLEMIKKNADKHIIFYPEYGIHKFIYYMNKPPVRVNNIINKEMVFEIRSTYLPDVYELWCFKNNKFCKNSIATISSLKTSLFVRGIFKERKSKNPLYVVCKYIQKFNINGWVPIDVSNNTKPDSL
jgi:hypothetical protein